jgi:putative NIF3 family GTP cyclohydrolase 1 type 2
MKVRDIDEFLAELDPAARDPKSPDGLKWGDLDMEVRAVGTTWIASMAVLREAAARDTNLIVTHEPTFWFHGTPENPELTQCERNGIDMSFKTGFLTEHGMAVIRAHNCWDRYPEYGIEDSLRVALGFPPPAEDLGGFHHAYTIPITTLGELAAHCKARMKLGSVRVSGDLDKSVERVVMAYGASSNTVTHYRMWKAGVDAVISGEQSEWSVIRPAIDMGLGVIELGHSNTEAFGMEGLARLLREHFPDVAIEHIPTGDSFAYV